MVRNRVVSHKVVPDSDLNGRHNVFPLPDYQANAVRGWFKNNPLPYESDTYNNTQKTRGFPDVSANGANYVILHCFIIAAYGCSI
jgi:hypothetical protein